MANWYDKYSTGSKPKAASTSGGKGSWYDKYITPDFSNVEGSYEAIPEPEVQEERSWFRDAATTLAPAVQAVGDGVGAVGDAVVESPINRLMAAGAVSTLGGGARFVDRLTRRDDSFWLENPLAQRLAISQGATQEQIDEAIARNRARLAEPTTLSEFADTSAGVARELRESVPTLVERPDADNRWSLQNLGYMVEQGLRGAVETLPGMLGGGAGTLASAGGRTLEGAYEDVFNSELEKGLKEGKSREQAEIDARLEAQEHFISRGVPAAALEFLPISRMMSRSGASSVPGNIARTAAEEAGAEGLGYAWNELYDVAARDEEAKPFGEYVTGLVENMVAGAAGGAGTAGTVGAGASIGRALPPSNTGVPAFDAGVNSVIGTSVPEITTPSVEEIVDRASSTDPVPPVINAPTGDLFTPNNEGVFVGDMFSGEPVVASDIADRQRLRDIAEARNEDGTLANPEMNRLPQEATEAEIEYISSQQERLNQLIKERNERIAANVTTAPTDSEIAAIAEEMAITGESNPVVAQTFENLGIRDWLASNNIEADLPEVFTPSRVPAVESPAPQQTAMELPQREPDAREQLDMFPQAPRVPVQAPVSPSGRVSTPTATTPTPTPKVPQKPSESVRKATDTPQAQPSVETRKAISNQLVDEGLVEGTRQYRTRQEQLLREAGFDVPQDNRRAVQTSPLNVGEKVRVKVDGKWNDGTIVSESPNKAVYSVQVDGMDKPVSFRDQEIERGERTVARERAQVPKVTKDALSKGLAALEERIKKAGGTLPPKVTRQDSKGNDVVDTDVARKAVESLPETKRREALVDMVRTVDPTPETAVLPRDALASSKPDQNTRVMQNILSRVTTADKLLDRAVSALKKAGIAPQRVDRLVAALKLHDLSKVGVKLITPQNAKDFGKKVFETVSDRATTAFYDPTTDTIYLKSADFRANGIDPVTQLHEILHAGTFNAIWSVENGKTKDKGVIEAVNDLKRIYNEFRKSTDDFNEFPSDVRFELKYAAKDTHEFASVVGSDIRVQRALMEKGLFRKFWDAVKRLLRIPPRVERDFDVLIDAIENVIRSGADLTRVSDRVEAQLSGVRLAKEDGSLTSTIEVDGVKRPTTNNEGNPIHPTEEGVRNFWKWFGDSKVVDENGEPLVVYHGTKGNFSEFKRAAGARFDGGWFGDGFYLTASPELASAYAMRERDGSVTSRPSSVMPVYVKMENPYRVNLSELSHSEATNFTQQYGGNAGFEAWLAENGYDGVIGYLDPEVAGDGAGMWEIVVFRPEQIKSATGNSGAFDPSEVSIVRSKRPEDSNGGKPSPERKGWRSVAALRVLEDWLAPGGIVPFGKDTKSLRAVRDVVLTMQGRMTGSSLSGHETEAQLSRAMKKEGFTDNKAVRQAMASGDFSKLPPKVAKAAQSAALKRDELRYNLAKEILEAKPFERMTGPEKAVIEKIINNTDYFTDVYLQDVVTNYSKDMLDRGEAGKATPEDMKLLEQVKRDLEHFVAIPRDLRDAFESHKIRAADVRRLYATRIGSPKGLTVKEMIPALENLRDTQDKENYNLTIQKLMEDLADPKKTEIGKYFRGSRTIFGDRLGKLEIPESFRKFWGYVNPDENIALAAAATIQKQTAVLNRVSTLNYLSELGQKEGWATTYPTKGSKQLVGAKWGGLANKFVPEVVKDYLDAQLNATQAALDTYNNMISSDPNLYTGAMSTAAFRAISGLSALNKANTVVGNLGLWVMAFGGGITSTIANGNFALAGFKRGAKGIFGGVGTAFRTNFNDATKELIDNKLFDSPTIRDVTSILKKDFIRAAIQKEGSTDQIRTAIFETLKTGALTLSEAYSAMDLIYTGSNYFYNKDGLKAHWDKIGREYTEKELQTEAAAMTRLTNISFAKVPKLINAMERLGGPAMFMGYMVETARVLPANLAVGGKQIIEGIKTGDVAWTRQGLQRLAGVAVATTMWQFLASMLRGGDEDDKEKRKVDALVANHHFVDAPTVVRVQTREDGTEVYLSMGRFDPYEPTTNIISAIAGGRNVSDSVKEMFIQNTLWARAINFLGADSPEQVRSKVTSFDQKAWDEWVNGSWSKAASSVILDTFTPSTGRTISGAITKAQRDEHYTTLQAITDATGFRLIEYHPVKSIQDFGRTFDIETGKAWTELSRKLSANRDIPEEEVRSVYAEYLAEERRRVADLTKAIEAAKESGGSARQIQQYLQNAGLSEANAIALARNPASFTRQLSNQFLRNSEERLLQNQQNQSPERQREIERRFRDRRRAMERAIRDMRVNKNGS